MGWIPRKGDAGWKRESDARAGRGMEVVDLPGRSRIVLTEPPRARTKSEPTIVFPFQSPPFTRTWGMTSSMSADGVSSENTATNETLDSDERREGRARGAWRGLPSTLRRRPDA